jgi:Ca-activated chloride channel homolog
MRKLALFILAAVFMTPCLARDDDLRQSQTVVKSRVRLVEVYATVFDRHDNYLADLSKDQFEIKDNGEICQIESVEPVTSGFSCAIMMDRTGSMLRALPTIKNAILRFIDAFREEDRLAVYGFNAMLKKSQDFTQDKNAAKQEVLRAIANGATAIFDSVAEVLQELSIRNGKKAIVVFTDGKDNSSYLSPEAVARRAKSLGIPLYFIAQGEAAEEPRLVAVLKEMSLATAGAAFVMKNPADVDKVFTKISRDLHNSYLLTYVPPPIDENRWRTIQLTVKGYKSARIRAREGYFPK